MAGIRRGPNSTPNRCKHPATADVPLRCIPNTTNARRARAGGSTGVASGVDTGKTCLCKPPMTIHEYRMTKRAVALADELTEGGCKVVQVDGAEVGLFLVAGEVRAYRNFCPHAGAPLSDGSIKDGVVRCPWHGWEFNLRTGAHMANPRCTLDAHRTEVAGGTVFVWA